MPASQRISPARLTAMRVMATAIAIANSSCALQGPGVTSASSLAYNDAVQNSQQQEILLNLVRLRFLDAPQFLAISSISTQMEFKLSGTLTGTFGEDSGADSSLVTPGGSVEYSESPTMTFSPRQDDDFAHDLMTPVDLEVFYLLLKFDWGVDRVLLMMTRAIWPAAAGDDSVMIAGPASADTLVRVATLLAELHQDSEATVTIERRPIRLAKPIPAGQVSLSEIVQAESAGFGLAYQPDPPRYVLTSNRTDYVLRVNQSSPPDPRVTELVRILNLPSDQSSYRLSTIGDCCSNEDYSLRIETRSVLEVMSYLSGSVAVPAALKNVTGDPYGGGTAARNGVLHVQVSETQPESAFLSVPYRGHWFFVSDTDTSSKQTLVLLNALYRLTVNTEDSQDTPVLTLPVGD